MPRLPRIALALITTSVILATWFGFVFHTSGGHSLWLGKYSTTYTAFLLITGALGLWVIFWLWRFTEKFSRLLRSIAPTLAITTLSAALVLPWAYILLHHRSLQRDVLSPLPAGAHAFFQLDETPPPPSTTADTIRILALGGSTTYGVGLARQHTYPALLEDLLQRGFPYIDLTVFNAGVPWHTSMHSLLRYVGRYTQWEPDILIVMHAFNDIFQSSEGRLTTGRFASDYGHFFGALGKRVNPTDPFAETVWSALSNNWIARTWYSDLRHTIPNPQRRSVDLLRPLPTFSRNLSAIVRYACNEGAIVILATQPFLYRENMPEQERRALFYDFYYKDYAPVPPIGQQMAAMQTYNDATRQVARNTRTLLVDLEKHLPKSFELMYDDVHYTERGARRVAGIIESQLEWESILRDRLMQKLPGSAPNNNNVSADQSPVSTCRRDEI